MQVAPEEMAIVVAALPLSRFRVRLASGEELTAVLHRGLVGRKCPPALPAGTPVTVERSPYHPSMCRIARVVRA